MDSQTQLSELEFAVKDHLYGIDSYEIKSTKIAMDTGQNDDTRDTKSNDNHKGDRKASNSDHFYYIDIKLLEDRHIQVSVSASGFYVGLAKRF
ncbi:hypothetical protein H4219_003325 [Mycoemilia scoparia]|uniref:Uncharacterized protein n=1 Tax=Mycoemilia scoparia TaxID=417184 RepID=A0A9W8A0W5_9FUNG|nr:hypothetical protein H4219_003325 [Mycoemilia scoparia]